MDIDPISDDEEVLDSTVVADLRDPADLSDEDDAAFDDGEDIADRVTHEVTSGVEPIPIASRPEAGIVPDNPEEN